jgi:hypothetical protein
MHTPLSLFAYLRAAGPWVRARLHAATPAIEPCRTPAPVTIPVRRPMPKVTALAAVAALALAAPAHAQRYGPDNLASNYTTTIHGQLVDVQVQVDGAGAPLYTRQAGWSPWNHDDRFYFEAFRGGAYALQLRNHTDRRVGVVISVDGLNVVNGNRTSLSSTEPMYVLDPWETTTIRGWRTSLDEVRQFRFVDEERSYAERTGQANGDMGWVRVATFEERRRVAVRRGWDDRDQTGAPLDERAGKRAAEPRSMAPEGAPRAENYPGTGWGERRNDRVNETQFDAVARATDQLVLRYEYASGLRALGIYPVHGRDNDRLRDRERGELGFARPPRW